jgi:serine protease AprX
VKTIFMKNELTRFHFFLDCLRTAATTFVFCSFGLAASAAPPGSSKLANDLKDVPAGKSIDVIVQFRTEPTAADVTALEARGAKAKEVFKYLRAGLFSLPAAALNAVAGYVNASYISPDRQLAGSLEYAQPTVGGDIAYQYSWNGSGVGVAVIDSGVATDHPDLRYRVVYSQSFVSGDTRVDDPYGHGTHVAGIVAGNALASSGPSYIRTFRGLAPNANIVNLRVLDANGQGTDSAVISAINRAIELKSTYNIRILNLSLGRQILESYTLDPLCQAVQRAWAAGLVVVVAAGNNGRESSMGTSGYATITSPANTPHVITVGAMKDMSTTARGDDLIASYSSKGPTLLDHVVKPDIVAPGNVIVSALAPNTLIKERYPENVVPVSYYKSSSTLNVSNVYFRLSGTSMAAPIVSGAAALLIQKQPQLTPDQVKARLMKTATKTFPSSSVYTDPISQTTYQSTYDLFTVGAGYLDIWAALNNNELPIGNSLSPAAVYDPMTLQTSLQLPPDSIWNNTVVWGTDAVWGTQVMTSGTAVVWGTAVIWATSTNQGFAVVWGTTVVWGTDQPFPEQVSVRGDQ